MLLTSRARAAVLGALAAGAALTFALASTGTSATAAGLPADSDSFAHCHCHTQQPLPTTAADWTAVTDTLGRTGTLMGGTVYRISLPRKDLTVTTQGVTIKPGLSLGGFVAFAKYRDGTMLMGDLVVTEAELPAVTDALQSAGIEQTALHKHLLAQSPAIWWTHIHAMGDPVALARGIKAALTATAIPPASPVPPSRPPIDLDTAGINQAIGRTGTADGGVYKFTIARDDTIVDGDGHVLPPALGVTTGINFQPLGGGRAAINGDFIMTAPETQHVIRALRAGGIDVVELHNHGLDEQPRLSTCTSGPPATALPSRAPCATPWTSPT